MGAVRPSRMTLSTRSLFPEWGLEGEEEVHPCSRAIRPRRTLSLTSRQGALRMRAHRITEGSPAVGHRVRRRLWEVAELATRLRPLRRLLRPGEETQLLSVAVLRQPPREGPPQPPGQPMRNVPSARTLSMSPMRSTHLRPLGSSDTQTQA